MKVLTQPGTDKILGVTIVGEHAGDLIAEYVLAMKHGLGLNKILGTIHIYPTLAEANKYAAGAWKRGTVTQGQWTFLTAFQAWRRGAIGCGRVSRQRLAPSSRTSVRHTRRRRTEHDPSPLETDMTLDSAIAAGSRSPEWDHQHLACGAGLRHDRGAGRGVAGRTGGVVGLPSGSCGREARHRFGRREVPALGRRNFRRDGRRRLYLRDGGRNAVHRPTRRCNRSATTTSSMPRGRTRRGCTSSGGGRPAFGPAAD